MSNISNIKISFIGDKFEDFKSKLKELSSIDDIIKVKISNDKIFMYSMITNGHAVLSLKSYLIDTKDYIKGFDSEYVYDFIIGGSKKFIKGISFFNISSNINLTINGKLSPNKNNIMDVRSSLFTNGRLRITQIGLEPHKIRDIDYKQLDIMLDESKCNWKFTVSKSDFVDIKKLSNINSDNNILDVEVNNGIVKFSEASKWDLEVDKLDNSVNNKITFIKKYLSNVETDDIEFIDFMIFNTFILVKNNNSNLMMSFETNFE